MGTDRKIGNVSAPTSAGKSTEFLACLVVALAGLARRRRPVWLIMPTRLNVSTYHNPWLPEGYEIVEKGGTPRCLKSITVMTYGQLLAHAQLARETQPLLCFDEPHLAKPEMIEAARMFERYHTIFLSATPRSDVYPAIGRMLKVNIARGGLVRERIVAGSLDLALQVGLEECKRLNSRMMVQVVGRIEAERLAEALTKGGNATAAVSALSRDIPSGVHIVGTAVVGVGVNVRPAPAVGVTSGVELVEHRGEMRLQHTTASTDLQQSGRYGRDGEAVFIKPPLAGTGEEGLPYPNWRLYTSSMVANANFNRVYGLVLQISQEDPVSDLRCGTGYDTTRIGVIGHVSNDLIDSLKAFYKFLTVSADFASAMHAYSKWRLHGLMAVGTEQITSELRQLRRGSMSPQVALMPYLDGKPYRTRINGFNLSHCGLRLQGYDAVPMA